MPGDEKWPPVAYKQQSEVDNEVRKRVAAQPVFRPRRPQKVSEYVYTNYWPKITTESLSHEIIELLFN